MKALGNALYYSVCFAPDGRLLALSRYDHVVETWDVAGGKKLVSWQAHEGRSRAPSLAFTRDGKVLMTAGIDKTVCFWEASTGKKLRRLEITAGAPKYTRRSAGIWSTNDLMREAELQLARQAEASYKRMVLDQQAGGPAKKEGASVTLQRA